MTTNSIIASILGFLLLACLLSTGCNPQITCWYSGYANNLRGRTAGVLSSDVYGPIFQTVADLDLYIQDHHLNLCGQSP